MSAVSELKAGLKEAEQLFHLANLLLGQAGSDEERDRLLNACHEALARYPRRLLLDAIERFVVASGGVLELEMEHAE